MPEAPVRAPYGDVYFVETPHLDRLQNQLYLEQKQREVLRQHQAQALDEEFRKNVSNVRDADVGDFTKKYQDWKKSKQQLMTMKPDNQDAFIAAQMATQKKLADVYAIGNKSKQAKDEEEEMAKDINKNPNNYADDAYKLLSMRRQTPLSGFRVGDPTGQGGGIDLGNADTFRYKGSNTDFGAILDKAIGLPKQVYSEEKKVDEGGRQTDVIPYSYGNTPSQVKDRLMGAFGLHQAGRDAEHQWDTIPNEEKAQTLEQFKAIPVERWKKMGIDNPQDLTPKNGDSKAEKLASLMAMQYAISNEPKQGTPARRNNQAAIDERNFAQQKEIIGMQDANARRRQAIQNGYQKSLIDYRKATGKKEQGEVLEGYIQRAYDEGKDSKGIIGVKGKFVPARKIAVPVEITDKYTISKGKNDEQRPVKFMITEDKQYVVPVYPGGSTRNRDDRIPVETFRNDLGKILLTKKDAAAEMGEIDFGDEENDTPTPQTSKPVNKNPLGLKF